MPSGGWESHLVEMIERSKLRDVVAKRLKMFIVDGNLKSSDRLPTESELATKATASEND